MEYTKEPVSVKLKTKKLAYKNFRPVDGRAYGEFDEECEDRRVFDMWEACVPEGESWIGVVDEAGDTLIEGEFLTCIHRGSYAGLMEIGKRIGATHPDLREFYFVYLNSPGQVAEADLLTKVVFR